MKFRLTSRYLLVILTSFSAFSQQKSPVGVQLYSFRNQFATDVRGTMQKVKDMGFSYIETAGFYGTDAQQFKSVLDEFGLRAVSTSADWGDLQDAAKLQNLIRNAKTLGAEFVTCFWIPHNGNDFTFEDTDKAVRVFNAAGKTLSEAGLKLLYHPHGYEFRPYQNELLFDYLVKNTNPNYLNFEMDIYWIKNPGQDPVAYLRKYPNRWKTMHLKDREKGREGNQNGQSDVEWNVTLGQGDQNMRAVLKQAKKNKIKYYFIEDESSRSLQQVPMSIRFLRSIMAEQYK